MTLSVHHVPLLILNALPEAYYITHNKQVPHGIKTMILKFTLSNKQTWKKNNWWQEISAACLPLVLWPVTLSSLVLLPFWVSTPVVFPQLWLMATASRREQLEVVSLRFRDSPLRAESAFLQAPPAPGSTHRLWLFNRPRHGGPFSGDNYRVKKKCN